MNSAVAKILNKYLGKFLENFNKKDLKLSIFSGSVKLNNVRVRPGILDELGLPFKLKCGYVGHIHVDIPWSHLTSSPIKVTIDKVYIILTTNNWVENIEQTRQTQNEILKSLKLNAVDMYEIWIGDQEKKEASFMEKFVMKIADNIQLKVTNLYIRVEDTISYSSKFALGITLNSLSAFTTNSHWVEEFVVNANESYKVALIDNLAMFMDYKDDFHIETVGSNAEILNKFLEIANKEFENSQHFCDRSLMHQFLLRPTSFRMEMSIYKITRDLTKPGVTVELKEINIESTFELAQGVRLAKLLEAIVVFLKFRKGLKAEIPSNSLDEAGVINYKRLYRNWAVLNMHTDKNKQKLKELRGQLAKIEVESKLDDVKLYRKQVRDTFKIEAIEDEKRKEIEEVKENYKNNKLTRLKGFFGSSKAKAKKEKLRKERDDRILEIEEEIRLLRESQQRLYSTSFNSVDEIEPYADIPPHIFRIKLRVSIDLLSLRLSDEKPLVVLTVNSIDLQVNARPTSEQIILKVGSITLTDSLSENSIFYEIMSAECFEITIDNYQEVYMKIHTGNFHVVLNSKNFLQLARHFIDRFAVKDVKKYGVGIENTAEKFYEKGQEILINTIAKGVKKKLTIDIQLKAPVFYIPYNHTRLDGGMLVVDMGEIHVKTNKALIQEIEIDEYQIKLSRFEALVVWKCTNYRNWSQEDVEYIINPLSIKLNIMCSHSNIPNHPGILLMISLKAIQLSIQNNVIQFLLKLVDVNKQYIAAFKSLKPAEPMLQRQDSASSKRRINRLDAFRAKLREHENILSTVINIQLDSFSIHLKDQSSDIFTLKLDTIQADIDISPDKLIKIEFSLKKIQLEDNRPEILFGKILSDSGREDEGESQISGGVHINSKERYSEINLMVGDIRVTAYPQIVEGLFRVFESVVTVKYTFDRDLARSLAIKMLKLGENSQFLKSSNRLSLSLGVRNIEVWLPLDALSYNYDVVQLSLSPIVFLNVERHFQITYSQQGIELSRKIIKIDDEATIEIRHFGIVIGHYKDGRIQSPSDRVNDFLNPSRITLDYSNRTPDQVKTIEINLESIMLSISLSDIFYFKSVAENWGRLKSLIPSSKKTSKSKSANTELVSINLILSCDALQMTLLDISGLSHHAMLHTSISNLSLELKKDSGFMTSASAIFMADYYNKSLSCWEPLIENWSFKLLLNKEFKDCPLVLNFKSDTVLNINFSTALCTTLINMKKSIEWVLGSYHHTRNLSDEVKKESFTSHSLSYYKIINNLGMPVTVCIEESGAEIWHLQPSEAVDFNQGDIEKLRLKKNDGRKNLGLLSGLQRPTSIFISIGGYDPVKGVKIEDGNSKSFVVSNGREELEFMMDVEGHGNLRILSLQSVVTVMNFDQSIRIYGNDEVHIIPPSESWAVPLLWIQRGIIPCIQDYKGTKHPLTKNSTLQIDQNSFIYIDVTHYKIGGSLDHTIIILSHALFFHNLIPFPITIHYREMPSNPDTILPGNILECPKMMNPAHCDLKLKISMEQDVIETGWFSILKEKKKISVNGELPSLVAEVMVQRMLYNKNTDLRNKTCLDKEPDKMNKLSIQKPKIIQFYFEYIIVNKTMKNLLIDEHEMLHIRQQEYGFMQARSKNKLKIALKPQDVTQITWSKAIDISSINLSTPLTINNPDIHTTAQIAVKVQQAPTPFEKSKIITIVPRFKVVNFLDFPICFGQYFLDQIHCQQNLHCIQPSDCLSFEYPDPMLESPLVCLGVSPNILSFPFSIKKYTDFQIMIPTGQSRETSQITSKNEFEFQTLSHSKTIADWHLPSISNNFMHYLRIVVTSDDQATIFINIMHPHKPDFIISNRIEEPIEVYQEGCTHFYILPFSIMPFAFENNFFKNKKLNIQIGDKSQEYEIEKVRKMKPLGNYGIAVELNDYSRVVIVENLEEGKVRRKKAKNRNKDSRSNFESMKNSVASDSQSSAMRQISLESTLDASQELGGTLLNGLVANVSLKGLGVSVVYKAAEFVYFSVSNIGLNMSSEIVMEDLQLEKHTKILIKIGHIQLDNMNIQGKEFPVILTSYETNGPFVDIYLETKANASKHRCKNKSKNEISLNRIVIECLECNLQELHLNINQELITRTLEIVTDIKDLIASKSSLITASKCGLGTFITFIDPKLIPCSFDPNKISRKVYIEKFKITPLKLITSFRNMKQGFELEFELKKAFGIFSIFSSVAGALLNISNFSLDFNSIEKKYVYESVPKVAGMVLKMYINDALRQLYKLFASADLIGNPLALYDRLEKGATELVNEPLAGLKIGLKEFILGMKYGIASLMHNSISGVNESISKITGTLYNLVRQIAGDSKASERIPESSNLFIGIYHGVTGSGEDIRDGLEGFVMIPYQQAKSSGIKGFIKGLGKGVLGLATCPISASLRLTTSITEGIAKTVEEDELETKQGRARFPRQFGARRFLEPYQVNIARAQDQLKKSKKYRDEMMLFYIEIEDYVDETVILTENHVIVLGMETEVSSISLDAIQRCELHYIDSEYFLVMGNEKEQIAISSCQMSSLVKLYSAIRGAAPNIESLASKNTNNIL